MKRFIVLLLAVMLVTSSVPAAVLADDDYPWDVNGSWLFLNGYTGTDTDLVLPATYVNPNSGREFYMHSVNEDAFKDNASITSVVVPEKYAALQISAFENCTSLKSVELPACMVAIDDECFAGCTALEEFTFTEGMSYLGNSAFANSGLKKVTFTGNLVRMEKSVFEGCPEELTIYVPSDLVEEYKAEIALSMGREMNVVSSGNAHIEYDHTTSADLFTFDEATGTIVSFNGYLERIDIPSEINGVKVTAIGPRAFHYNWENGYTYYLSIPEGVTVIGNGAFYQTKHLSWVDMPSTVKEIGYDAFSGYRGERLQLNDGIESFDESSFSYSAIESINIPADITAIPDSCFAGNQLTLLELPEGVTSIGYRAFATNNFDGVIELPASLETIGEQAFYSNIFLDEVRMKGAVKEIGTAAFDNCVNLITLYMNVTELPDIAADAFKSVRHFNDTGNHGKVVISNAATAEEVAAIQKWFDDNGYTVDVEADSIEGSVKTTDADYTVTHSRIGSYTGSDEIIVGPEMHTNNNSHVYGVDDHGFEGNTVVKYFIMPASCTYTDIGVCAFKDSALERIDITEGVTEIGASAFEGSALTEIVLPASLEKLGADVFKDCAQLKKIEVRCDASLLTTDMLAGCTALEELIFTNGDIAADQFTGITVKSVKLSDVASIGTNAFAGNSIEIVEISGASEIGDNAFGGNAITSLKLENVEKIGANAFEGAVLEEIALPDGVTSIGANAFASAKPEGLTLPVSLTELGEGALGDLSGLKQANINCDLSVLPAGFFSGAAQLEKLTVEKGAVPAGFVKGLPVNELTLGSGITEIGAEAFADTAIVSFVIPSDIPVGYTAFAGIEELYLDADATDAQLEEATEVLGCPWYAPLTREGEPASFVKMTEDADPASDFEFDPETGTISKYIGSAADVVVPAEIDGVEVKRIAYAAFDSCRDYTDTGVITDRTEWVHLTSLVLPETIETIDDQAFSYCQQLESFICYAPLESTGKAVFLNCTSLDEVVFVNGVRMIDNYCFDHAGTLSRLDYGTKLESIGTNAFVGSRMKSAYVDANFVANTAYFNMEELERVIITERAEKYENGAFNNVPKLTSIYLKTEDFSFSDPSGIFAMLPETVTIYIPETAGDDAETAAGKTVCWSMPAVNTIIERISLESFPDGTDTVSGTETEPVPDDIPTEAPTAEPEIITIEPTEAPVSLAGDGDVAAYIGKWYCVYMSAGAMQGDPREMYGLDMTLVLNEDGTAVLDFMGEESGSWAKEEEYGTTIVRYSDGAPMQIIDGGLLMKGTELSGYMVFSQDKNANWTPSETTPEPVVTPAPTVEVEPVISVDPITTDSGEGLTVGTKYTAYSADMSGVTIDASLLGAEYSLILNADNSIKLVIAGAALDLSIKPGDGGFAIDYYGMDIACTYTDEGFDMDYFGSMLLHFKAE